MPPTLASPHVSLPHARGIPSRLSRHALAWPLVAQLLLLCVGWWLFGHERALVSLLIAPWVEETLLRHGLQDRLHGALRSRLSPWAVPVACALAFAAVHVLARPDVWSAGTFFPALLIGFVYQRHGALAPCVLLHALFNLFWFASIGLWLF